MNARDLRILTSLKRVLAFTNRHAPTLGSRAHAKAPIEKVGAPETIIQDLLNDAEALEQALADRDQAKGNQVGATAGIHALAAEARLSVQVLDALFYPLMTDDMRAEWASATR